MSLPSIFDSTTTDQIIERINQLSPDTQPIWGKMSTDQMLAHLNVSYELVYEDKHPQPNFLMKWVMTTFVKKYIVNEKPYPKSSKTAPYFVINDSKNFQKEKERLIAYIHKTQELGSDYFEGKTSHSFGDLTAEEWNNMFYKHLDHHLRQFGK